MLDAKSETRDRFASRSSALTCLTVLVTYFEHFGRQKVASDVQEHIILSGMRCEYFFELESLGLVRRAEVVPGVCDWEKEHPLVRIPLNIKLEALLALTFDKLVLKEWTHAHNDLDLRSLRRLC